MKFHFDLLSPLPEAQWVPPSSPPSPFMYTALCAPPFLFRNFLSQLQYLYHTKFGNILTRIITQNR